MKRWLRKLKSTLFGGKTKDTIVWQYKVVQMVAQAPANPDDASRRLGGSLSAEALRNQFPEYYNNANGRAQICDFLNELGHDGWELIQVQQVADLPLMIFKRPLRSTLEESMAMPMGSDARETHARQSN